MRLATVIVVAISLSSALWSTSAAYGETYSDNLRTLSADEAARILGDTPVQGKKCAKQLCAPLNPPGIPIYGGIEVYCYSLRQWEILTCSAEAAPAEWCDEPDEDPGIYQVCAQLQEALAVWDFFLGWTCPDVNDQTQWYTIKDGKVPPCVAIPPPV